MPMNTANKLTLLRVFLIPVFLVVAYWGFPGSRYVALAIYIVACLTDLLDGYIARHYNQVSDFGKFADPLADKCLVMAALGTRPVSPCTISTASTPTPRRAATSWAKVVSWPWPWLWDPVKTVMLPVG